MNKNQRHAFELMGEDLPGERAAPGRVSFSIQRKGISISASVTEQYFEAQVLPVIGELLTEIRTSRLSEGREKPRPEAPAEVPPARFRSKTPPGVRSVVDALSARTGPELLKAAAVSLAVVKSTTVFSREQLLAEAEDAVGHWRKSHSRTVGSILEYLISSGVLIERTDGKLCLNPVEEKASIMLLRQSTSPHNGPDQTR